MMPAHFTSTLEVHTSWLNQFVGVRGWYGGVFQRHDQGIVSTLYPGYVINIVPRDEVMLGEESVPGEHVVYAKLHEAETRGELVDVRCGPFPLQDETFLPMLENYTYSATDPYEIHKPVLGYRYFLSAMHQRMRVWLRIV